MKKAIIEYNFEEDILLARALIREYDSSFQLENFILDLNKDNNINGIELLNASKVFGVPKESLKDILSGKIELNISNKQILINIRIKSKVNNSSNTSSVSIQRIKPKFISETSLNLASS